MPAYAYILRCADGRLYVGCTGDLARRLEYHRRGESTYTAPRLPIELVYLEECETVGQAKQRERSLKNGRTRRKRIEQMIASFPPDKLAPFA